MPRIFGYKKVTGHFVQGCFSQWKHDLYFAVTHKLCPRLLSCKTSFCVGIMKRNTEQKQNSRFSIDIEFFLQVRKENLSRKQIITKQFISKADESNLLYLQLRGWSWLNMRMCIVAGCQVDIKLKAPTMYRFQGKQND